MYRKKEEEKKNAFDLVAAVLWRGSWMRFPGSSGRLTPAVDPANVIRIPKWVH